MCVANSINIKCQKVSWFWIIDNVILFINAFYSISYPLLNTYFLPPLHGTHIQYNMTSTPYYFDLLYTIWGSKNFNFGCRNKKQISIKAEKIISFRLILWYHLYLTDWESKFLLIFDLYFNRLMCDPEICWYKVNR